MDDVKAYVDKHLHKELNEIKNIIAGKGDDTLTLKESEIFADFLTKSVENMLLMTSTLSKADKTYLIDILNKLKFYKEYKNLLTMSEKELSEYEKSAQHLNKKAQSAFGD